jgi:hypothetical protein
MLKRFSQPALKAALPVAAATNVCAFRQLHFPLTPAPLPTVTAS